MPVTIALLILLIKYGDKSLKLRSTDYAVGYWFILSLFMQIVSIINFKINVKSFILGNWIRDVFASLASLFGCVFACAALTSEEAPYGIIIALFQTSLLLMVIVEAI